MARMYPDPIPADTKSMAERMLYDWLQAQLDHIFVVLHGVSWISHSAASVAHDGEADFIIAHPQHGVLLLEAKGERSFWMGRAVHGSVSAKD